MEIVTKQELAKRLRLCQRTVENLMRNRLVPFVRIGRLVRFNLADVERALAKLTVREATR